MNAKEIQLQTEYLKEELIGKHIGHPLLYCSTAYIFHLSGSAKRSLNIVLDDSDPRVYLSDEFPEAQTLSDKFFDLVKKELNNAYVVAVKWVNEDRVIELVLSIINGVFKEDERHLYIELVPHHANLVLSDGAENVIGAYRTSSLGESRPLLRGLRYEFLPKKDFVAPKEVSFAADRFEKDCLSKEILLSEKRKKERFGFLFASLKNKQKLLKRKIGYIQSDLKEAEKHLNDGKMGDAIYMLFSKLDNKQGGFDYEGRFIALDPGKSLSQNAQTYYKRAKKAKAALKEGASNLESAQKSLLDTESALAILAKASEPGLELLAKEIGISPQKPTEKKKNSDFKGLSSESVPFFVDYHGTKILFGKSARQNDTLTFLLETHKNHLWLHVEGTTGSHLIIKSDHPTDDEIEMAAMLALLNSSLPDGEVIYAPRGEVRKGSVPGQAIIKNHKTIFIRDISEEAKKLLLSAKKCEI